MTRYGLGRIRSCEQSVCSAGVSRCNDGLLARLREFEDLRGFRTTEAFAPVGLGLNSLSWLLLASDSPAKECARRESGTDD